MTRRVITVRSAAGSLYGLAYGDSLGKPTEFQTYETIVATYGSDGPRALTGHPALVTDDTQMALAVGEALLAAPEFTAAALEPKVRRAFLEWAASPDNNRAPGMTCLRACADLSDGRPWQLATQSGSKGCGANMRVTPVGLGPGLSEDDRAGVGPPQAAMTHGHPTALAASELTAFAARWLGDGLAPGALMAALRDRSASPREVYREDWLGDLWRQYGPMDSPTGYMALGWDETDAALARVEAALAAGSFEG